MTFAELILSVLAVQGADICLAVGSVPWNLIKAQALSKIVRNS